MVGTKGLSYVLITSIVSLAAVGLPLPDRLEAQPADEDRPVLSRILDAISSERMLADIRILSGSGFNGRQTGTRDDLASAEFVQKRFANLGNMLNSTPASPGPSTGDWIQARPVSFTTIDQTVSLQFSVKPVHSLTVGSDYLPVLDSPSADVSAPVLFIGYGIADPENGLDEYEKVDAREKIVLFLRGKPDGFNRQVSHADKVRAARQHGAIGYLTTTGPLLSPYEARRGVTSSPSAFYAQLSPDEAIPGAWIDSEVASEIVNGGPAADREQDRLRLLQQRLNETRTPQSLLTSVSASLKWRSITDRGMLHNVGWLIKGSASDPSAPSVLIGAHRDHFGRQAGLLFPGADDNASGTAVLLEVARLFASAPFAPVQPVLFLSFSGEEQGLLGSREYVANPLVPLSSTAAMINIDHAGIGNGRLTVGVTGFGKAVAQQAGQAASLSQLIDLFGFFPGGDHVPFKEAGIPTVTVVSGGVHPHFHRPGDRVETLDPAILTAVARYVATLAWQLANPR
ncbi:MAG TPA: M28 family peptidase [Nitrospiraceae bacterium]|nr:M28 family peptidase [Nitrospiraceae bacterium]